jgi:hypothetical protein
MGLAGLALLMLARRRLRLRTVGARAGDRT